jgi:hypothetical protein
MTPGLSSDDCLYAVGLAVVCAAMLSFLPALRPRGHACRRTSRIALGGATLRFGRVWTGAMVFQVALTAHGIPIAMETAHEASLKDEHPRAFPSRSYLPLA